MYNKEFIVIINKIINKEISQEQLIDYIMDDIDCDIIYNSENELISDIYFSLKHYASGEEKIEEMEWKYLLQCLKGERQYDVQDKMSITTKPSLDD